MNNWERLDSQMRAFGTYLRDNLQIPADASNGVASVISEELASLDAASITQLRDSDVIPTKERLDELVAFQSWMDLSRVDMRTPAMARATVVYQNYLCFVYLNEALFQTLRKIMPGESVTKKCSKFLTDNPVRAFRNAIAHGNWQYRADFTGLIFWARKGSDVTQPMTEFIVDQGELNFWQALSRCAAYVAYTHLAKRETD
jgi:hypothetical protein